MVAVADETGRILMEAFHWRYHPLADRMKDVFDHRLGQVESLAATFNIAIEDRTDIRHRLELGGGSLMDLGCYPVQWVRHLVGRQPVVDSATAVQELDGVDQSMTATLRFDSSGTGDGDLSAVVTCSMADGVERTATVEAVGSNGTMSVINPLAPQHGHRLVFNPTDGSAPIDESIDSASTYHHQLAAFAEAVATRKQPPTGGADSLATMAVIDDCYRAAGMQPRSRPGPSRSGRVGPVDIDRSGVDRCFGCGADNLEGMQLHFDQRDDGSVETVHWPAPHHCGLDTVVHGGIQATILDEVMGVAAQLSLPDDAGDAACVTAEMNLRYRAPVPMDGPVVARATVERVEGRDIHVTGLIVGADGQPLTEATSRWRQLRT
jgi:acyl-coenzyme A thioesterase PaaI-like protein